MNWIELDRLIEDVVSVVSAGAPKQLSLQQLIQLLDCARELRTWREEGVTEELLRRHDGCIKVGNGCVIALEGMNAKVESDAV